VAVTKEVKMLTLSGRDIGSTARNLVAIAAAFACLSGPALADQINLKLSGAAEVPPVATKAEGTGKIVVGKDGSVTGTITTKDVEGTAAHIHTGAAGKNGPPIITLEKSSPSTWTVPAGAKLNESQLASYRAGELYVNIHSAAHQAGEIRAQLVSK
jgi:hypothetical protein